MLYNRTDGTRYSLDTVLEIMVSRFAKNGWAYVSDILGSDWSTCAFTDEVDYQINAFDLAKKLYN